MSGYFEVCYVFLKDDFTLSGRYIEAKHVVHPPQRTDRFTGAHLFFFYSAIASAQHSVS